MSRNLSLTLRKETEWVEAGWNTLVGYDPERIARAALEARPGRESAWPYGDSRAGERLVTFLVEWLSKENQ